MTKNLQFWQCSTHFNVLQRAWQRMGHRAVIENSTSCFFPHCICVFFPPPVFLVHRNCLNKKTVKFLKHLLKYRGGSHMRSLISIDFPAPKMKPESAHVVSAVSVHWLQCGDCDAARPRQHSPTLRYSALLRYPVLCFNSTTQCNSHDIETMTE